MENKNHPPEYLLAPIRQGKTAYLNKVANKSQQVSYPLTKTKTETKTKEVK